MVKLTPLSWCAGSVYSKAPPTTTVRDTQRHPMDATVIGIPLSRYATPYTTAIYHAAHYHLTSHGVRAGGENGIGVHTYTYIDIINIHIYLPTPTTHRIFLAPISESEGATTPQPILFSNPAYCAFCFIPFIKTVFGPFGAQLRRARGAAVREIFIIIIIILVLPPPFHLVWE